MPALDRPATGLLVTLAGMSFVAHMLVAGNYGYFRDELYYIADGRHLQLGYVDQPLLMGWLAALLRVTVGDSLVAIHVIPALACALIIVVTGLMARELGGGRVAQLVAGVAALFTLDFMGTGSLFSMDVLDQLWWALASLILVRLLRRDAPRLWLLFGLVVAIALLTKLTVLFFGLALVLALLVTRRAPLPAHTVAMVGGRHRLLGPAALPHLERRQRLAHRGVLAALWWHGTSPLAFFTAQIGQMNPIAVPLAAAGLVFYFRRTGARYRLLGWTFVFAYLVLTLLRTKAYFLAPTYPILFAAGAVVLERWAPRPRLAWIRPAYVGLLALAGILLAPDVMPILPPATTARVYGALAAGARRSPWLGQPHQYRGAGLCRSAARAARPSLRADQQLWRGQRAHPAGRARSPAAGHQRSQQLLPVGTGHVYRRGAHRRRISARRLPEHVRRRRGCRRAEVPVLRVLRAGSAHRRCVQADDTDRPPEALAFGQAL